MKVLVVEGWEGQNNAGLGAVRALGAAGHHVDVAHASLFALSSGSRHVSKRHRIPRADSPDFASAVGELLERGGYQACLPTGDAALVALDMPGAELTDKVHLQARADASGVRRAASRSFASGDELADHAGHLDLPLAVKESARPGSVSGKVWRVDSHGDLEAARGRPGPLLAETWLEGEQRAFSGVVTEGRLVASTHQLYLRTWPLDCGVASAAVTTEPDRALEERVLRLLGDYEGIFQVQLIDGRVHDVNPRVFGSVSLGVRAGANLPELAAQVSAGRSVPSQTVRARPGVRYRWLEGDARHLWSARARGDLSVAEVARALRPARGTAHPDFRLSDPLPALQRLRYAFRQGG